MNLKTLVFLVLLAFTLASCTTGSQFAGFGGFGSNSGTDIEPTVKNGDGLRVSFRTNDEWISLKQVTYELSLENDGREPLTIYEQDFRLTTSRRDQQGGIVFDERTVEQFYESLFSEGQLTLLPGQELRREGVLEVANNFFYDLNLEQFNYELEFSYDYITEFSSNAVFDPIEKELDVDGFDQAAPIKVTRVDMRPRIGDDYDILFYVSDRGESQGRDGKRITIDRYEYTIGTYALFCDVFYERDGTKVLFDGFDPALTDTITTLIYVCPFDIRIFDDTDPTNTLVYGSIEYEYVVSESGTIRLPEQRRDEFS